MSPHKGICVGCKKEKWIQNSRGTCSDCVFEKSHNGKSRLEVNLERQKQKQDTSNKKVYQIKRTPLKTSKKPLKKGLSQKRKEVLSKDRELYRYIFNAKPPICEECGKNLPEEFEDDEGNIIAIWRFSHILSKGAYPEFRYHKLNFNLLCLECHTIWDFGDRESMGIFQPNQEIIKKIKKNPLNLI